MSRRLSLTVAALLALSATASSAQQPVPRTPEQAWRAECASCHMAYPPGYLPERSWRRLLSGLDKHFGEDASLDAAALKAVTQYLLENSAERSSERRASRFLRSIPAGAAPLRITETGYFIRKHDEVAPDDWKRPKVGGPSNCVACHSGAEKGDFSERNVRIPR
jgi:hypothetical protein